MKRIKLYTLGCKVNQYESQAIREKFLNAGFRENNTLFADIYIINTCSVTARADSESHRLIRKALQSNPQSRVIVTGCLVEKDTAQILQISDKIRIVPNRQKHRIIDFLNFTHNARLSSETLVKGERTTHDEIFLPLNISDFKDHERAFVKIQDGCSNSCSYCKVPLVRGSSRSRSLKEIVTEVKRLTNRGFKELVLSGICLGDYRYKDFGLAEVVTSLEKIQGEFRIRLSSIEPQLISHKLIKKLADSAKLCPHLHIPLQSADNAILKKMNRRYTVENYLSLITRIKKSIRNVAITTDILIGFPGESAKNFRNTLSCLKEILPLRTHIFPFSPREGTAAFSLQGRIEPKLIKERLNLLKKVAAECSCKFRKAFSGKQVTVLIESQRDRKSGLFCGYSENYIRVAVENATQEDINKLVRVKVKAVDMHSTKGQCL